MKRPAINGEGSGSSTTMIINQLNINSSYSFFIMSEGENYQPKTAPPPPLVFSIDSRLPAHTRVLAKMIARWHLALLQTFMSPADKPIHHIMKDKELF